MVDNNRANHRESVRNLGKKEFTFLKMQEYGFWPKGLPTPYERQESETKEDYEKRESISKEYEKVVNEINNVYKEKESINIKLKELKKELDSTWDYDKIRKHVAKAIMDESVKRRKERKEKRELEKKIKSDKWKELKSEEIVFIGKGYSGALSDKKLNKDKLESKNLPILESDKDLAEFLGIEYEKLRFLVYHRDVVLKDHYYRYQIPKRKGGFRNIAAPKTALKEAQKKILEEILYNITVSNSSHGFLKGKSVVSGAKQHNNAPDLLINIDLENFFPSISFERVRGLFKSFGYSGYISSMLSMICTYCERMAIEVKDKIRYVKVSDRILPQGSPASPMITNIICIKLDKRLEALCEKNDITYSRYADDISFSYKGNIKDINISRFIGLVSKIVKEEGFNINKSKTKFLKKHNSQRITGIVVNNDEVGIPKKWIRVLRSVIYNGNKTINSGETLSIEHINKLKGMISWVKNVNEKRYEKIINDGLEVIKKCSN